MTDTPVGAGRRAASRSGVLLAALAVLAVSVLVGLAVGSRDLPLSAVVDALTGGGDAEARAILLDQRLPRTIVAVIAGAALAVAGVLMQGHTRNPLADPGLLGVTAGSSVLVVFAISVLGITNPSGYLWFAFGGAAIASVIVTAIAMIAAGRRDSSPATLVLAGAAVSAFLSAITGIVLLLDSSTLEVFRFWTVGSLSGGRDLELLAPAIVCVGAGLVIALAHGGTLDALVLGDDVAKALGRRLAPARLTGLAAVTLLVGGAVALAGSLGFIGLVAPHIVRTLVGQSNRWVIPLSAIVGAVLVVAADVLGRVIVRPAELPVGVVLAVIGAPAFLVIVLRMRRAAR
jgi:iron complex transport system permease protein